jgi:hypothetical protein
VRGVDGVPRVIRTSFGYLHSPLDARFAVPAAVSGTAIARPGAKRRTASPLAYQ